MPEQAESPVRQNHTPRVCIVDDDPSIRECLRFLFEEADFVVEEAEDGAAAFSLLRRDACPRVLLLDRMMPRVDGAQMLHLIKSGPAELQRRTVIIFMSARNDPPDPPTSELIRSTTLATVTKPFDLDILLAKVTLASKELVARDKVP